VVVVTAVMVVLQIPNQQQPGNQQHQILVEEVAGAVMVQQE
jgi:hypothetical protein